MIGHLYNGYARVKLPHKRTVAHRAVWELLHGEIPKGKVIMHTCDNRNCINPKHLQLGTQKENVEDCRRKGNFKIGGRAKKADPKRVEHYIKQGHTTRQAMFLFRLSKCTVCKYLRDLRKTPGTAGRSKAGTGGPPPR